MESLQSFVEPCETSGPTALAESCGTLKPSYNLTPNHPGSPRSPRRTSWDPARTVLEWNLTLQNLVEFWWNSHGTLPQTSSDRWWNPGETLEEPSWNLPRTTPHPRRNWWNPGGTLVRSTTAGGTWRKPGGTLVEPYLKPPRTTLQPSQNLVKPWQNSGGTLVEPSSNHLTSNHPGPPCSPGGTLVEPYLKPPRPPRSLVEPWRNPREPSSNPQPSKKLVEPWWNLSSGSPRTTPEPIWAETPKLSAVGEKLTAGRGNSRGVLLPLASTCSLLLMDLV